MSRANKFEYNDWKGFGSRTKYSREKIGMTKERFAEAINRSENYVSELEKGRTSASVHTLHQIATTLKVSTDYLLYGETNNEEKTYTNKEIMQEIVARCNDEELKVMKEVTVAIYPNLKNILKK